MFAEMPAAVNQVLLFMDADPNVITWTAFMSRRGRNSSLLWPIAVFAAIMSPLKARGQMGQTLQVRFGDLKEIFFVFTLF